jgi:MFS transporter, UMF1 family
MARISLSLSLYTKQLGMYKGVLYMANIFLGASLLYLASKEANCLTDEDEVDGECNNRVYGFLPSSLITNIAVISGLTAAFLMPVMGAILDYTPYRRMVGLASAIAITVIQAIQIGTVSSTWFAMSLLQALASILTQVQLLASYAYLPDIARTVGEEKINIFTKWFSVIQFITQDLFLISVVVGGFSLNTVQASQLSQVIQTIVLILATWKSWGHYLTDQPAANILPEGRSLWTEGFRQNWRTCVNVNRTYKKSLRWFLVAVAFCEAGATALIPVTVTFLTGELGYGAIEIGVTFVLAINFSIGGAFFGAKVTEHTNPLVSWKLSNLMLALGTLGGSFLISKEREFMGFVFGALLGFLQGWFYPCENIMFSMCLPKGQEAELTGIYIYCSQILVWLPPFCFSILVENRIPQRFGLLSMMIFQLIGLAVLSIMPPWEEILEEIQTGGTSSKLKDNGQEENEIAKPTTTTLAVPELEAVTN